MFSCWRYWRSRNMQALRRFGLERSLKNSVKSDKSVKVFRILCSVNVADQLWDYFSVYYSYCVGWQTKYHVKIVETWCRLDPGRAILLHIKHMEGLPLISPVRRHCLRMLRSLTNHRLRWVVIVKYITQTCVSVTTNMHMFI